MAGTPFPDPLAQQVVDNALVVSFGEGRARHQQTGRGV